MLYVVNLIVPLFYMLVLDVASFFVHASKGEKLSFKITVLLSISVLLLILQDMLPSTEENLPMIGGLWGCEGGVHTRAHTHILLMLYELPPAAIYFVSVFALVGISVLETMLVLFVMDMEAYCSKKFRKAVKVQKLQNEHGQYTISRSQ